MSRTCGFDPSKLDALLSEEALQREERATPERSAPQVVTDPMCPPNLVWVSAAPPPPGDKTFRASLMLRDALAQLGRLFFDREVPVPIITAWNAAVTPQLLEGAARFGRGGPAPLVHVFMTDSDLDHDPVRGFADWRRGRIIRNNDRGALVGAMLKVRCRCAIVLGGGADTYEEGRALLQQNGLNPQPTPLFAVASTGGAAAEQLDLHPHDFGGQHSELELKLPTSYLVLMSRILRRAPPRP